MNAPHSNLPALARAAVPAADMTNAPHRASDANWRRQVDAGSAAAYDPLRHLGALTIYFFWIALVSGIYLFLFYETSLSGAWLSVERLTHDQWFVGGVMRSLHRYASDAAVITMLAHLTREFLRGRCRGPFWFSWVSGVPLLWLVFIFGISGYWMVWDELSQFVAVNTARLLDWLPIFTDPMTRSFLTNDAVSERFFTLIAFVHLVGLPIVLVIAIWVHLLRVRLPRINPPRPLMAGAFAVLLAVSLLVPAVSHAPADFGRVPMTLAIDWFYLAPFPLLVVVSEGAVWALLTGVTLVLVALPWLPPAPKPSVAEVHLDDCSACGLCAEDCPYGAIDLVPRSDGRHLPSQAQVDASLCVGCGICVGACPAASPLRHQQPLTAGIELPGLTVDHLKSQVDAAAVHAGPAVVVFGCDHGVPVAPLAGAGIAPISLPCIGMLPTAFLDYALRSGVADGVVIAGCASCRFRFGDAWFRERLSGARQPALRARVPRDRLRVRWLGAGDADALRADVAAFHDTLQRAPACAAGETTLVKWWSP